MLSEPQRQTILELHAKGMGVRQIARTLGHARPTVRRVLAQGAARPPEQQAASQAIARTHLDAARALLQSPGECGADAGTAA